MTSDIAAHFASLLAIEARSQVAGAVRLLDAENNHASTVPRALEARVKLRGAGPDDFMFVDESGTGDHRMAEVLRAQLWEAGVRRHELHNDGKNSRKLRVHDLRATFTTLTLANGKSEAWVKDQHRLDVERHARAVPARGTLGARARPWPAGSARRGDPRAHRRARARHEHGRSAG